MTVQEFKMFHIGDVLSITTERLVSPRHIQGVYDILEFMTGEGIWTHQIPRVMRECRPALLKQFPSLDSPEIKTVAVGELSLMLSSEVAKGAHEALVRGWLSKITLGGYGIAIDEMLPVERLAKQDHTSICPIEEARAIAGDENVIAINVPDGVDGQ